MVPIIAALLIAQTSSLQVETGLAFAPGGHVAPVVRVARSWPVAPAVGFQIAGGIGMAGVVGSNTNCGFTGQCFTSDVDLRAWAVEIPALFTVSAGPVFVRGGPVMALRLPCVGRVGGQPWSCPASEVAWGGAAGIGIRPRLAGSTLTIEARLQQFSTPLVTMFTGDAGGTQDFKPKAVLVSVGWAP